MLGTGFAAAAGTPPFLEIARDVLDRFGIGDTSSEPDERSAAAFIALLEGMDAADRAAIALRTTSTAPVPQFADEMALLVRDRCFHTIVTTSFDALAERALEGVGMTPGRDYEIVDLLDRPHDLGTAPVTVVKAYAGGLPRSDAMADALDAECVVVGPGRGDPPLVHALAYPGGPLWWVSPEPVDGNDERAYRDVRDLHQVRGPAGEPDRFFAELSLRLLQIPSIVVQRAYDEGTVLRPSHESELGVASVSDALANLAGSAAGMEADVDDFERLLVQARVDRCRDAIRRLERRGGGVVGDEGLDAQLAYERRQLASLEERLYVVADTPAQLAELLHNVLASLALELDAHSLEYVDTLVAHVDDELKRSDPNEAIVGASVGAVAVLADRAGVDPDLVRRLAGFAPTTSIRLGP